MTIPALAALALTQQPTSSDMTGAVASGGPGWVVAVNLVIWTGLFLYLLRLERRLGGSRREEKDR
jgi:CcmD family protein